MDSEDLRRKGNAAFAAKKFDEAVDLYTLVSTASREKRAELSGGGGEQNGEGFGSRHRKLTALTQTLGLGPKA